MSTGSHSEQPNSPSGNGLSVNLAKPPDVGLADWMSQLRNWLDHQGIAPAGFKYSAGAWGGLTCEVTFLDRTQADLFIAQFHQPHLR